MFLINAKLVNTGNPSIFGDLQGEYGYTLPYVKRGFLKEYVKFTVLTCCVFFLSGREKENRRSLLSVKGRNSNVVVFWFPCFLEKAQ